MRPDDEAHRPPRGEVRHLGALDIALERRGDAGVVVRVFLATRLVGVGILGPDLANWRFEAEAGGASAHGELTLALAAPGYFCTIHGDLHYTASGTWNRYRGLLSYWEQEKADAAAAAPAEPEAAKPVSVLDERRAAGRSGPPG